MSVTELSRLRMPVVQETWSYKRIDVFSSGVHKKPNTKSHVTTTGAQYTALEGNMNRCKRIELRTTTVYLTVALPPRDLK